MSSQPDDAFFEDLTEELGSRPPAASIAANSVGARKEYKVLTSLDKWFLGRFDGNAIEETLNTYAQAGWQVVSCCTARVASLGSRDEIIIVLERDR